MSARRQAARLVAIVGMAAVLSACSTVSSTFSSIFGASKPKSPPLEAITSAIAAKVVWTHRVDSVKFPMAIAVNGGTFTVAGTDGTVTALQAEDGREIWRTSVGSPLSAGVGSDGRYAAVVTRNGELVVLEAGRQVWRQTLGVRINTAPLVAGERVFVLGSDRSVQAFDVLDGRLLWTVRRPSDPLTLAQGGVIAPFKDTLLVGQGPRMAGLDPVNGSVRWEVAVASPRGTNEIERLADLIGPAVRNGDVVCSRAFQSAVGCVNAERGTMVWTKNVGGTDGVAADAQLVAAADATDRITAWKAASGEVAWISEKLAYRGLSTPVLLGNELLFGDAEGTVHFLSRETGATQLRLNTDSSGVVGAPAVAGKTVLMATRNGGLYAMRLE